jgi:hypothetical protein
MMEYLIMDERIMDKLNMVELTIVKTYTTK